jgi:hypothetical protein
MQQCCRHIVNRLSPAEVCVEDLLQAPLPGHPQVHMVAFSLSVRLDPSFFFSSHASLVELGPTLMSLAKLSHLCKDCISKSSLVLRDWQSELQHMNLGE